MATSNGVDETNKKSEPFRAIIVILVSLAFLTQIAFDYTQDPALKANLTAVAGVLLLIFSIYVISFWLRRRSDFGTTKESKFNTPLFLGGAFWVVISLAFGFVQNQALRGSLLFIKEICIIITGILLIYYWNKYWNKKIT